MADRNSIKIQDLREAIQYDPNTGKLTWVDVAPTWYPKHIRNGWGARFSGTPALATMDRDGYMHGKFQSVNLRAHHAAWAIHYGEWPTAVDHIDGNRANNAIANLRLANATQNTWNRAKRPASTSQYIGVYRHTSEKTGRITWRAVLYIKRVRFDLGYFASEESAARAYDIANWARAGRFAKLNFPEVQHDETKAGNWDGFVHEFRRVREHRAVAA